MKKKRILLMTTWMPQDPGRRTLMHELADAFVSQDCELDAMVIDWRKLDQVAAPRARYSEGGYSVYRFQPLHTDRLGVIGMAAKWLLSSLKCLPATLLLLFRNRYDMIVVQSPAPLWAPLWMAQLLSGAKRYLIQWDFTPYHQRAIGMMKDGPAFRFLLWLENITIRKFHVIGCMSEMNIAYLRRYYRLKPGQHLEVLPIWSAASAIPDVNRAEIRGLHGLPQGATLAVFGGTLSHGRGIEDILEAAKLAAARKSDIRFVIVGSGPLEEQFRQQAKDVPNVQMLRGLPRPEYQKLLKACDIGLVATERNTGMPAFPSKTMDYFLAGIPIVASVENTTDYGAFLEKENAGLALAAGNARALLAACESVATDKMRAALFVKNGKRLLEEYFSSHQVVSKILDHAR